MWAEKFDAIEMKTLHWKTKVFNILYFINSKIRIYVRIMYVLYYSANLFRDLDQKGWPDVKQGSRGWFIGKTIFVEGTVSLLGGLRADDSWFDITISATLCCHIELWTLMDHPVRLLSHVVSGKYNSCFATYTGKRNGISFSRNSRY